MCGIVTFLSKSEDVGDERAAAIDSQVRAMTATLDRRGPDAQHVQRHGDCWLGHARLSIIDLAGGDQPIYNEDGSVGVVFNGEIYNYRELRDDLRARGHTLRTESDTEVLVHLYEDHGERLFEHLNGMFAAAIYDARRKVLLVGRDRAGEKPVLYHEDEHGLTVASEMKAFFAHPGAPRDVDPDAIALYLNLMAVPAPWTILKGVRKLLPAHYLKFEDGRLSTHGYWQPDTSIDTSMTLDRAREEFEALFADSVKRRMIADVPLGVFLSGGIDSSAVTAFAARASETPVRTFSVGFGTGVDERPFARMVAERYGTDHREIVADEDLRDTFEKVMTYFDEPFADNSALPTYLVSKAAREHVTVVLTGDGGDELFAGYDSYLDQKRLRGGRVLSRANREVLGLLGKMGAHDRIDAMLASTSGAWAQEHWHRNRSTVVPEELAAWLPSSGVDAATAVADARWLPFEPRDPLSVAFQFDTNVYLPDDLLKKVDMASMLCSLECRAPFLDHRLIEFTLRIPPALKLRHDDLKAVLKYALRPHLPSEVLDRPKQGFGAPVTSWVNGPLKELSADLLGPGARCEEWIPRARIDDVERRIRSGADPDFRLPLQYWSLLALEWWLRTWHAR